MSDLKLVPADKELLYAYSELYEAAKKLLWLIDEEIRLGKRGGFSFAELRLSDAVGKLDN